VHGVQVILPFLKWSFDSNNGGGGGGGEAATMLDILSRLVQEQPTAMALIRQQIIPTTSVPDPSFICTDPDPSINKQKKIQINYDFHRL
jgi:hypothetical protein